MISRGQCNALRVAVWATTIGSKLLKRGYIGDHIGEYYGGFKGDRSFLYSLLFGSTTDSGCTIKDAGFTETWVEGLP